MKEKICVWIVDNAIWIREEIKFCGIDNYMDVILPF